MRVTFLPPRKLNVDPALKGKTRRQAAGLALQDIMIDTAVETARCDRTLFAALVDAKRTRDTGKPAVADPLGSKLSYAQADPRRAGAGPQARRRFAPAGAAVGVMLPNSVGVAVTFFALQSIGRVPAMINFSSGAVSVRAACNAAKVSVVLTSRAFVEKARLTELVARDRRKRAHRLPGGRARAHQPWRQDRGPDRRRTPARCTPARRSGRDPVHLGLGGQCPRAWCCRIATCWPTRAQCLARVDANGEDLVFNVLPVFHSFGLTGGLMMPLVGGIPVYLYPSPLHYRIVPELIYDTGATIMFGTDTFLRGYARSAHPYDLRTIRLIVAGAEAVKDATRQTYMERFGVRILEGYGVTETAPVLAMNTPIANRSGTVGRLSPLMQARLEPVAGITEGGRLFVKGPNVMLGYCAPRTRACSRRRPTAGTTPATSSRSTRRASSPSRAAPSASPRSAARWCRCRRSRRWPPRSGRRSC